MVVRFARKSLIYLVFILIISASIIAIIVHRTHIFNNAIDTWNYEQLQKINKTKNEFSFVVFGDTRDSKGVFDNLIEKINQEDALFSVDNGDFVSHGTREEYKSFLRKIGKINKPLLTVIGNHDIEERGNYKYFFGQIEEMVELLSNVIGNHDIEEEERGNYKYFFGDFYYSFCIADCYFIALDVNNDAIEDLQLRWLENELLKSQKYKYRFVFMHTPLYDPRKGEYARGHSLRNINLSKRLNEIFDKNNITMLFTGHLHGYFRGIWGKTPYTISGGGGAPLQGNDPKHFFYHYIKVRITGSDIQYDIVKFK